MCVCVLYVVCVGMRGEISEADLSKILPEEVEEEVRQAAEISMGTEVPPCTTCTSLDRHMYKWCLFTPHTSTNP